MIDAQRMVSKHRNNLIVTSWNIQSRRSSEGDKFQDDDFLKYFTHDIICLQETKGPIKLKNYKAFNSNRSDSLSGGVAILYKPEIAHGISLYKTSISPDFLVIKFHKSFFHTDQDTFLVSFYISPSTSSYRKRQSNNPWDLLNNLLTILSTKGEILLCGDSNARTGLQQDDIEESTINIHDMPLELLTNSQKPRNNSDKKTNVDGNELIDLSIAHKLTILNGRTIGDLLGKKTYICRRGTSVIDYALATQHIKNNIYAFRIGDYTAYSDHRPLHIKIAFTKKFTAVKTTYIFDKFPDRFKWNDEQIQHYQTSLNAEYPTSVFDSIINDNYSHDEQGSIKCNHEFTQALLYASQMSMNKIRSRDPKYKNKWFNSECARAKKQVKKLARKMTKDGDLQEIRDEYFETKKAYRHLLDLKKRNFRSNLNKSIESGKVLDWKNCKFLKQTYDEPIPFDNHDLASFYEYFSHLYKPPQTNINVTQQLNNSQNDITESLNEPIRADEIIIAIKRLRPGKSVAEDLISNEMLKNLKGKSLDAIVYIFNRCLTTGTYPWHESVITPIYKSGDKYDPDNYRAIAVSSSVGKLFSSILLARLIQFRKENCDDPINQLGFTKRAQTSDHLFTLSTIISKYKLKKRPIYSVFIDFRKAFDSICRQALFYKLATSGVVGKFYDSLRYMYSNSIKR